MGDVSAEPSMEDILSSIKRIIAEDGAGEGGTRARRTPRPAAVGMPARPVAEPEEVLELHELAPADEAGETVREDLVSPVAAEASRGSLDALTRMIARPEADPSPAGAGQTLDAFVADLLRPLLREWLDAHLPEMVEAMVAKEIARITGNR